MENPGRRGLLSEIPSMVGVWIFSGTTHSGARIRVFEENRKHKSPLKLLRIQAICKILLFFMKKSWLIHCACVLWRMFLMLVIKY